MTPLGCNAFALILRFAAGLSRLRPAWLLLGLTLAGIVPSKVNAAESTKDDPKPAAPVSYYRDVRPIIQANCQGCHQPAKSKDGQ